MEKFYIIPKGTDLRNDYEKFMKDQDKLFELVQKFRDAHSIETTAFYSAPELGFEPTDKDLEKYGNHFKKDSEWIKKNSELYKSWKNMINESGITSFSKPHIFCYFSETRKSSSRMFMHEDVMYVSIKSESEPKPKEEYTEIKGSEFYKVIESFQ